MVSDLKFGQVSILLEILAITSRVMHLGFLADEEIPPFLLSVQDQ